MTFKVLWRSAIDSDQTTAREDEFNTDNEANEFIEKLNNSRNRTFIRKLETK